jgi:hypothetical protein
MKTIDPIFKVFFVIYFFIISILTGSSGKSIRSMVGSGNVNKIEMEGENSNYPSIDTCTRRDVRVREHPFDIPSVDFNYQIPDADEVKAKSTKGAVEAINFEFWLRVSGLSFVESD